MNFNRFEFEASFGTPGQLPAALIPEIAFAGRSNVGKSSLINKILNRKNIARTSSVPGKTVTVNFFTDGYCRLADLPGYGYAKVPKSEKQRWADLMEGYFQSKRNIRLVVQLIDMRHKPSAEDYTMLSFLKESGYDFIIAMTKCDKLKTNERLKRLAGLEEELKDFGFVRRIPFSSETGEGADELRAVIGEALKKRETE